MPALTKRWATPLVKLRLGFLLLGVALLLPLALLYREAQARFEFQRRLRHEIVAERIFDEMERDLTTLLEFERERPSAAYETPNTRVENWSPFVVGYFRFDGDSLALPAEGQLQAERALRVRHAVTTLSQGEQLAGLLRTTATAPSADAAAAEAASEAEASAEAASKRDARSAEAAAQADGAPDTVSQEAALRQLNRAANERLLERRKQRKKPRVRPAKTARRDYSGDDPLSGL